MQSIRCGDVIRESFGDINFEKLAKNNFHTRLKEKAKGGFCYGNRNISGKHLSILRLVIPKDGKNQFDSKWRWRRNLLGLVCGDETANLPLAQQAAPNYYSFYYHHNQLQHLIDMLRYEKPITVFFNNDNGFNNSRISTSNEPVGEGEED
jgi:hypothetical protein